VVRIEKAYWIVRAERAPRHAVANVMAWLKEQASGPL